MVGRLGQARSALIVTGGASARDHAGMVKRRAGEGRVTLVAGVARGRGRDVTGRLAERVPLGIGTVVAVRALASDDALGRGMREGRGRERAGVMARVARQGCRDMVARFGHARTALNMASRAGARAHAGVTECRAGEARVTPMTGIARGRGRHMAGRFAEGVPLGVGTIVASAARTGDDALSGRVREGRSREWRCVTMAGVARHIRRDMIGRLGRGRSALDVTGSASTRTYAGMVETGAGKGRITLVAGVARGRGRDVTGRLPERVPLSEGTVMTGVALTSDDALSRGVREGRGRERASRRVTSIARQIRRDVVARLGHARTARNVTGRAGARVYASVIECGAADTGERHKTRVAGVARGRGRDVTGWFAERVPLSEGTVMTGAALASHHALCRGMSEARRRERAARGVAGIARERRRNVVVRLGHARPARNMALGAATRCHADMHETRAHPGGGAMASVARCRGGSVVRRFALGDVAVMALTALVGYHTGVTEKGNAPRRGRGVTGLARLGRHDVIGEFEGGCLNTAALCVAGGAFLGRSFKGALNVTGLAGECHVCPGQRETRFDVVKTHVAFCGRRQGVAIRQCEQEKAQDCQGSDPERRSAEINSVLHSQVLNPDSLMNCRTTDSGANFLE